LTRARRHEQLAPMIRVEKPAVALQESVRCYVQLQERLQSRTFIQPIPARTAIILDFTLGSPGEVWSADRSQQAAAHPVALVGAQTYRRVDLAMQGHVDQFVIFFLPGGHSRLFRVPPGALTNQHFDGREVLGRSIDDLRHQLGEASSFAQRVKIADNYLLDRVSAGPRLGITAAALELHRQRGCLSISGLADRSGLSLRHFERRFAAEVGMSPKLYARVARFEAAIESKAREPRLHWTDVAHDLGYHDQMHMVRDFRRLASSTPTDLAPRMGMLVARDFDGVL
jgi:AraC-like DNA-binding protein